MSKVRKAVIPAAGLGTRFLPATKAIAKEMLPIVDKPTIQFIVEEAIASGIKNIIVVTGKAKRPIEDHFDSNFELKYNLKQTGKDELLALVEETTEIRLHFIRQKRPKGLGDAVLQAKTFVGNEPFVVMLGDDIMVDEVPLTKQLMNNLAYTMAQTGRNVLIVDSDLRKPTVHRTFKLNNELGLTTLLANPELKFNQVVQKSKELGLYFLPSGPMPPNPAELIGSPQMARLMQELSDNFDMVIYDTPPVNSVTDAQIISSRVDGVILMARQNFARKELVREAKQALENVKANILGFVINNVPFEEGKGYGYYAYGLEDDDA